MLTVWNCRTRHDDDLHLKLPFAEQAAFNSYDKQHDPPCLPDTRVDVRCQIETMG